MEIPGGGGSNVKPAENRIRQISGFVLLLMLMLMSRVFSLAYAYACAYAYALVRTSLKRTNLCDPKTKYSCAVLLTSMFHISVRGGPNMSGTQ